MNVTGLSENSWRTEDQIPDYLLSSSRGTSFVLNRDNQHRSSSSKVYHDYKRRTSLISIPTSTMVSHSAIIHPIQKRFELHTPTLSTSVNEKLTDMTLSSKHMNMGVINQLNEHLSTRFRKEKQEICSNNNNHQHSHNASTEYISMINKIQSHIHDEHKDAQVMNSTGSSSKPPPPPPYVE